MRIAAQKGKQPRAVGPPTHTPPHPLSHPSPSLPHGRTLTRRPPPQAHRSTSTSTTLTDTARTQQASSPPSETTCEGGRGVGEEEDSWWRRTGLLASFRPLAAACVATSPHTSHPPACPPPCPLLPSQAGRGRGCHGRQAPRVPLHLGRRLRLHCRRDRVPAAVRRRGRPGLLQLLGRGPPLK